jgi:hypothetical protein
MKRLENLFLTPLFLKIVKPDKEEDFEGNGDRSGNCGPLIEEDDGDRSRQAKVFKRSKKDVTHPPLPAGPSQS